MPKVIVLMLAADTIQDPGEPQPEARVFEKDKRYPVDVTDARKLIGAGSAAVVEVPHQDGLPRGTSDSNALLAELQRLAPPPAPPSSQPVPLPDPPAAPAKE